MLRKLMYIPGALRICLLDDAQITTISKSELEKFYKAWILATTCKWYVNKLDKNRGVLYPQKLKLSVPPVMPFLRFDFYEDFWNAFIVIEGVERAEAIIDMPPHIEICPHKRSYSFTLYHSIAIMASQAINKSRNNINRELIDTVANMLIKQVFPHIKNDIRRKNAPYGLPEIDPVNPEGYYFHVILDIPVKILQPVASNNKSYKKNSAVYDVTAYINLKEKNFEVLFIELSDKNLNRWMIKRERISKTTFYGDPELINKYVWERIKNKLDDIVNYLYLETEYIIDSLV